MKLFGLLIAALVFYSSPVWAGCRDGEELELTGTVSRIFANKQGGWSVTVTQLNREVLACDLGMLMGQKTAAPFFVLAVKDSPSGQCRPGSHVRATLRLSEGLADFDSTTVRWQCH